MAFGKKGIVELPIRFLLKGTIFTVIEMIVALLFIAFFASSGLLIDLIRTHPALNLGLLMIVLALVLMIFIKGVLVEFIDKVKF